MKQKDELLLAEAYSKIYESTDSFKAVLNELSKGIPGPSIFSLLQSVKNSGNVSDLIQHLNSLGEQNEDSWYLKDNLIKALFMGLTEENI